MTARASLALALALCAVAPAARAQELEARALLPYGSRGDALQCVVVTARPRAGVRGDLTVRVQTSWPYGETRVRQSVALGAGAARTFVIPAPVGPYDYGAATLDDLGASASITFGGGGTSATRSPTYIAVLGLGGRVTAAINAVNPSGSQSQARVLAATMLEDPASGDPIIPPIPSAFGGTHAVVAGAGAILAAPPEARRALREWVTAGGFLAVSPRTIADLRDPWFVELLGPVSEDAEGRLSGPRLVARRWGAVVHHGLGVAGVIPYDLSTEAWARDARADAALRDFTDFADGAGGGMIAPGELTLFRRFARPGDDGVVRAFRPRADVRGLLIPVTALLTLYIIAVGVALARNRRGRAPLKVFTRLPLAALAVLAVIFAAARLTRTSASTARVLALYDLGEGSGRAVERVMAGLNAGVARTLAVAPPGEGVALYATGGSSGSSAMRWDGQRLSVERVRLGLWESGLVYTERMVDAGGGIRLEHEGSTVRVINRSPWTLDAIALESDGVVMARFPAAAPGATVSATIAPPFERPTFDKMFPGGGPALARTFVESMMGSPSRARAARQLFALARLPDDARAYVSRLGFAPGEQAAVVRVVLPVARPDPERVGAYSARLGVRRNDYEPDEPDESPVEEATGDAGAGDGGAP